MDTRILTMHRTEVLNEQLQEMRYETQVWVNFIKALMFAHWRAECNDAMATLKEIDPKGWERWYDMECNDGSWKVISEQVRERIEALKNMHPDSLFPEVILLESRREAILKNYGESDNRAELDLELAEIQKSLSGSYSFMDDRCDSMREGRFGVGL